MSSSAFLYPWVCENVEVVINCSCIQMYWKQLHHVELQQPQSCLLCQQCDVARAVGVDTFNVFTAAAQPGTVSEVEKLSHVLLFVPLCPCGVFLLGQNISVTDCLDKYVWVTCVCISEEYFSRCLVVSCLGEQALLTIRKTVFDP